jgi:hypothetical protein
MLTSSVHFFDRAPAPHLTVPSNIQSVPAAPLKNHADTLKQIDQEYSFRFLKLDGVPIARTDKKFPMSDKSPMRERRQLIRDSALKMMQAHRGHRKSLNN